MILGRLSIRYRMMGQKVFPPTEPPNLNDSLKQYLAESDTCGPADKAASATAPNPVRDEPKQTTAATETELQTDNMTTIGVAASSKWRSAVSRASASTTASTSTIPPSTRMTRSRSSSFIPRLPVKLTVTSTTTASQNQTLNGRKRTRRSETPITSTTCTQSLLRDAISSNLILLLVGVNPGIRTGATGHAYAHPSNLFWKLLHSSGITSIQHPPSDTYKLPDLYNVGNTNIVERPTRDASMLNRAEMDAGVPVLEAKIARHRPEAVCLVGKGVWEAVWRVRHGRPIRREEFRYGWQDETENMGHIPGVDWCGASVFVATTTSGLAAGMKPAEKEAVWAELGSWVVKRRGERALTSTI